MQWGEAPKGSARDLLAEAEAAADPEERSEMGEAVDWLRALLAHGPVHSKEIRSDAKRAGIAWRTVERTKTHLGAEAVGGLGDVSALGDGDVDGASTQDRQPQRRPPTHLTKTAKVKMMLAVLGKSFVGPGL